MHDTTITHGNREIQDDSIFAEQSICDGDNSDTEDIEDRVIDKLDKLRKSQHFYSNRQGDCIDDFITYRVTPELKHRPSYEKN